MRPRRPRLTPRLVHALSVIASLAEADLQGNVDDEGTDPNGAGSYAGVSGQDLWCAMRWLNMFVAEKRAVIRDRKAREVEEADPADDPDSDTSETLKGRVP